MIEQELARAVLLERQLKVSSPEWRFHREWRALRAAEARDREIDRRIEEDAIRLDRLRERLDRAA